MQPNSVLRTLDLDNAAATKKLQRFPLSLPLIFFHTVLDFSFEKLLVHPQGQRPLVKELGIAIAPGYETLVGMQLKQVSHFIQT